MTRWMVSLFNAALLAAPLAAQAPVASYLFPAGGQRGTEVPVRVGGLFLHNQARLDWEAKGLKVERALKPTGRVWFEGPLLPLPESQRSEDYPFDMQSLFAIAKDAPLGESRGRIWTSQGVANPLRFVVGDLPEAVEREIDGDPIPQTVTLPVTANGRIFPREDIDLWRFEAKKGQSVTAFLNAASFGSPVLAHLDILDAAGAVVAEPSARPGPGMDAMVRFTAPADGRYCVRIQEARNGGGQQYVYRLTITAGPVLERVFPLGGQRGTTLRIQGCAIPLPDVRGPFTPELPFANRVPFDVDDVREFVEVPKGPVSAPAMLNGRILEEGSADEWRLLLKQGVKYDFDLRARKLGSPLCARVAILDPTGRELARHEAANALGDPTFAFQPPADGEYAVRIAERFRHRAGPEYAYRLKVVESSAVPGFKLTVAADAFNVPRGGTAKAKVTIERTGGFAGPVELAVQNLPAGITAPKVSVAAKQATAEIPLSADPLAKVRLGMVSITGTATVGTEPVTQRAANAEADTFAVVATVPCPFAFTGEYTLDTAPRGQPYKRGYTLERNGFDGPVTVRLADRQIRHLQGVTAPPIVVPPGRSNFEYSADIPPWIECGRTSRTTLVAVGTVRDPDGTEHTVGFTTTEQNHQMIMVPEPGRLGIDLDRSAVRVEAGKSVRVPFRVSRAKGVGGPVAVEALVPQHFRGLDAKAVVVDAGRESGELILGFAAEDAGPFNMPLTIRAKLGALAAEAKLELIPPANPSR
jgi:hypothetical protein